MNNGVYALIQGEIASNCFGIESDPVTACARKVAAVRRLEHQYQREPLSPLEAVLDNVECKGFIKTRRKAHERVSLRDAMDQLRLFPVGNKA